MTLAVSLCIKGNKLFPYKPVPYSPKIKAALIFDTTVIITLLVVGILAIIGSGTATGQAFHSIGATIGTVGGSFMIAASAVIMIFDSVSCSICTGFKADPSPQFKRPPRRPRT